MGNYKSTLNNGESCQHNWQCHSEFCCNPYGTGSICIDPPRSVPFGFRTCPENTVCRTVRPYRTDRLVPQRMKPGIRVLGQKIPGNYSWRCNGPAWDQRTHRPCHPEGC